MKNRVFQTLKTHKGKEIRLDLMFLSGKTEIPVYIALKVKRMTLEFNTLPHCFLNIRLTVFLKHSRTQGVYVEILLKKKNLLEDGIQPPKKLIEEKISEVKKKIVKKLMLLTHLIQVQGKTTMRIVVTKADENIKTQQCKNNNIANKYERRKEKGKKASQFSYFPMRESADSV